MPRLNLRLSAIAALLVLASPLLVAAPAVADGGWGTVDCAKDPTDPRCVITVGTSDAPGSKGSSGTATCKDGLGRVTAERTVTLRETSQPFYLEGYHRPAATDADDAVYTVISDLLSNGRTSRLYRSLVRDKKLAVNAAVQLPQAFDKRAPGQECSAREVGHLTNRWHERRFKNELRRGEAIRIRWHLEKIASGFPGDLGQITGWPNPRFNDTGCRDDKTLVGSEHGDGGDGRLQRGNRADDAGAQPIGPCRGEAAPAREDDCQPAGQR